MELPKMKLARSCALSLSNDPAYVLNFATQKNKKDSESQARLFAASVSGTNEIKVYSKDTFCSEASLVGHSARITSIRFDIMNSNIIWSSSLDGTLRYWNIKEKSNHIVSQKDEGYTMLDINCDGTILAAGMECVDKDSIDNKDKDKEKKKISVTVEFWDISDISTKSPQCIHKFESIHSNDITSIVFHPENPNILVTGSTDGLATVLDISSQVEDTALIQTLNTESSINIVGYFGPSYEFIYILNDTETFTIWKYKEGDLLTSVIDLKKRFSECNNIDYVIDCLYHKVSERLFLVGGANDGRIEILHMNLDVIEPYFSLKGGHSSIVRCITFEDGCLLSGAEDGMVCAWRAVEHVDTKTKDEFKIAKKVVKEKHKKKKKPYLA